MLSVKNPTCNTQKTKQQTESVVIDSSVYVINNNELLSISSSKKTPVDLLLAGVNIKSMNVDEFDAIYKTDASSPLEEDGVIKLDLKGSLYDKDVAQSAWECVVVDLLSRIMEEPMDTHTSCVGLPKFEDLEEKISQDLARNGVRSRFSDCPENSYFRIVDSFSECRQIYVKFDPKWKSNG